VKLKPYTPSEHQIQSAVVLEIQLNSYFKNFRGVIFKITNEGRRTYAQTRWLKREGLLCGAPDLCVLIARKPYHGLLIEFKSHSGIQSEAQKIFQANVEAQGYKYVIYRSAEEAIKGLKAYIELEPFQ
jgi:predicted DNA-binding protein (UPF0278 family)